MSELPEILTKSTVLPSLASLDAGDVIECYTLFRMAKLENVPFLSSSHSGSISDNFSGSDNSNSTASSHIPTHIEIRKSAVAFRYKPKPTSKDVAVKAPFEMTVEYGPQRTGVTQGMEAMPFVNGDRFLDYGDRYNDQKYVSWENHAKIYYTLSIDEEKWTNAYYMAPITGAVLSKIVDYIIDYPTQYPRYQPFSVVAKDTEKTVLKSSNSDDFVWSVFGKLADLYVRIQPVLSPKRYSLHMYVDSPVRDIKRLSAQQEIDKEDHLVDKKHEKGGNKGGNPMYYVANAAAEFYEALYSCVGAIKSGDYSTYVKTQSPTQSPTLSPTSTSMTPKTSSPTSKLKTTSTSSPTHATTTTSMNSALNEAMNETISEPPDESYYDQYDYDDNDTDDDSGRDRVRRMDETYNQNKMNEEKEDGFVLKEGEDKDDDVFNDDDDLDPDTISEETFDSSLGKADDAKEAAEESEKAAEEAKTAAENVQDDAAVVAAEHAVEAAKKAAQATSDAAALTAIEGLLSGDGTIMTSILSSCFSDEKYNIRKENQLHVEGNRSVVVATTNVYLYVDGAYYYRVNITAPYLRAVEVEQLPWQPRSIDGKSSGDFIDFALASGIAILFFFGVLVMLHQVGLVNWGRIFQFRWFFHPGSEHDRPKVDARYKATSMYDEDEYDDEERSTPSSRNDRIKRSKRKIDLSSRTHSSSQGRVMNDRMDGIEMVEATQRGNILIDTSFHEDPQSVQDDSNDRSSHNEKLDFESENKPERMIQKMKDTMGEQPHRDPDSVQFPDLKSYSKVAQPIGVGVK